MPEPPTTLQPGLRAGLIAGSDGARRWLEAAKATIVEIGAGATAAGELAAGRVDLVVKGAAAAELLPTLAADPRSAPLPVLVLTEGGETDRLHLPDGSEDGGSADGVARLAAFLAERELSGEAMVRGWLDSQEIPMLGKFLLESLHKRLSEELDQLTAAVFADDGEKVRYVSHRMKGWTGTYQMVEISRAAARIEKAADGGDRETVCDGTFELGRVVARIPRRYLLPPE